jgi:hypothetical protein
MRALVVYESMFGDTEQVAQEVAKGLRDLLPTEVVEVGAAPPVLPDDLVLVVVGAPTHAFGMSRPGTRKSAATQAAGAIVSRGSGVREWLARLAPPGRAVAAATFDTRFDKPRWLTGSAARAAARRLRQRGYRLIAEPASFFVTASAGPVADGELARARRWGATVGTAVPATVGTVVPA